MRVLVDIVHPADVLFYKNIISDLGASGHDFLILARDKDVTHDLLDAAGLDYQTIGKSGRKGPLRFATELMRRLARLTRLGMRFKPDLILTRNPAGVMAAKLLRVPGIFDTDDGRQVGIYWRAAVPFATVITMPDYLTDDYRGRRVAYPSYKALAHLHPNRFSPDPSVRSDLGLSDGERYFIVRLVALAAFHDRHARGIDVDLRSMIVSTLSETGRVFMTTESPLPPELADLAFPLPPHRMHDALAYCALLVGDSQSMTAEAAVLGVPSIRLTSWAGRLPVLTELESEYGLSFEYTPDRREEFEAKLRELSSRDDRDRWQEGRRRLLADKIDLTPWYEDLMLSIARRSR